MECKGRIKFYDEEMDVQFPEDFNLCKKKIGEMIGLSEDELLKKIKLYYNDEDGDKILLTEDNDYKIFFNFLKENDAQKGKSIMIIELRENSEILVKKISEEMSAYKEKHSEEIKNEVDIMNQIKNENLVIKNNKEEDNGNKINENDYKEEENNEKENNNENNLNQQENQQDNQQDNHQDNNINQDKRKIIYEETCTFCKAKPLYDVFYYCLQCDIKMCSKCELELGKKHSHPFSKIQTYDQYMHSHINLRDKVNNTFQQYGGAIQNFLGNLSNMISNNMRINNNNMRNNNNNMRNNNNNMRNNNNNMRNNNNINQNNKNYKNLIQKMKNDYELNGVPDEKIEEALIKSNGDINKALEYLF